jgi:hypothetical protein
MQFRLEASLKRLYEEFQRGVAVPSGDRCRFAQSTFAAQASADAPAAPTSLAARLT